MTILEMQKIVNKASQDGFGDMDLNEYLREYDEYQTERIEELEERQNHFDTWQEFRDSFGHGHI